VIAGIDEFRSHPHGGTLDDLRTRKGLAHFSHALAAKIGAKPESVARTLRRVLERERADK